MAIGGPQSGDEAEGGEGGGIFADINITPLTDIFLVLLIIFMVTTTAIAEAGQRGGFQVNLPKGSKSDAGTIPRDLVVAVLADGRAVIGGKVQSDEELARTFDASAKLNPDTVLVVQADAGVPHGRVVAVMEAARQAGLSRLAIATQIQGGEKSP
jgi:biopolymer transport protein ExbD